MFQRTASNGTTDNSQRRNENRNENKQTAPSTQQYDYPPISIKFKNQPQHMDRQLINELIEEWRKQHNRDLNIIGRFGYNKSLLVFASSAEAFDDMTHKTNWPEKINESEYEIKLPRIFTPPLILTRSAAIP